MARAGGDVGVYPQVLDKVRRFVFMHSVRLLDFMKPFDRLNHGEITFSQFFRGIRSAGIRLSEDEAFCLADAHECPDTGLVKYREFCEEVNQVFRTSGLEENPYIVPVKPGEVLLPIKEVELEPAEASGANEALCRLRLLTKTRRLDLRSAFAPFDRHNTGKLSQKLFERAFPIAFRENKFTEEEVRLLGRLVTTPEGLVDCRKLCLLVEGSAEAPAVSGHQSAAAACTCCADTPKCNSAKEETERETAACYKKQTMQTRTWAREQRSSVKKIETAVAALQLPIRESFRDFDGLRHGVCTREQAKAVLLSVLKLQLDENDLKNLFNEFVRSDGMFDYEALCTQIQHHIGNPEAEHFPLGVVPVPTPAELRTSREDKTTMTPEEIAKLKDIQDRLAFKVKQTSKVMLPTFQDFDKGRTQHVTRGQLWRILGMLDLPVSREELDLLCLWLCDKGNLKEVAYRPLLAAIDPPAEEQLNTNNTIPSAELVDSVYYMNGKVVPLAETIRMSQKIAG